MSRYQINKTKYLLDEEKERLEKFLIERIDRDVRNCLMLLTLLYTGARASEVLGIGSGDLNAGTVLIRGLKGSDDREVPVPEWLYARLTSEGAKRPSEKIFNITYQRLNQIWQDYRPVRKNLHSLRHTFAITQLRKHGRLDVIKKLLGHRRIENTMVYADYAYTNEEFRKLVI
jgi:integrase